jgi:hypothetical protein
MPCTDRKHKEWMGVASGSTYELSVTGPAGFAAFAQFDDGRTDTLEMWPSEDITPGPKKKKVAGAGEVHFVFVFVNIDPTKDIEVTVKATVDGKPYCRTISGKGTQEIVVHTLRMA